MWRSLLLFALYAFRALGGGDVKLLTVLALWVGWPYLPLLMVLVGLIGGVIALLVILGQVATRALCRPAGVSGLASSSGAPIPYGIAIVIAAWLVHIAILQMDKTGMQIS